MSDELTSEEEEEYEEDAVAVELENGDEAAAGPAAAPLIGNNSGQGSTGMPGGSGQDPPRTAFAAHQGRPPPPSPPSLRGSPNGGPLSPRRASRSGSGWEVL